MEKLNNRRRLHSAPLVLKFCVPPACRAFPCEVRRPPRTRGRFEIGLHVRPAMTLDFHHTRFDRGFKASLGRTIVLLQSVQVRKFLVPWRGDPFPAPVNIPSDHVGGYDRMPLFK